ncbi:MAG: Gfo/Idh/MocA family oxidoreductase [Planctomycetes bacterium]|nr:Gfo/Idh/MocA family oxidoreductase [Planctomycetota bacterium]
MSKEPKKLRAAVVGAGHLGKIHARIYSEIPHAELVGVVDVRADKAKALAEIYKTNAYDKITDIPGGVDVVSVAATTSQHAEISIPLLRSGIAVLVEKPIAASLEEADAMLAAARDGKTVLSVGHSERFNPIIRAVHEISLKPRFAEVHRLAPFSFRSQDVGVVLDLMIHDLDLLLRIVDSPIAHVDAVGGSLFTNSEDIANARVRFENGCVANITASRASLEPLRRMRFFSPEGYISIDLQKRYALLVKKGPRFDAERGRLAGLDPSTIPDARSFVFSGLLDVREVRSPEGEEPLRAEIEAFLAAVRGSGPNPCSGEEGRRALEAATRIMDAMDRQIWRG